MIAAAMHIAPGFPKTAFIAATATRSCGACWISENGRSARYETFARTYKVTTIPLPIKSARTRFFPGSRTSLPRNVTFVHAVWAKIGPTIDLPRRRMIANPPAALKPGCANCGFQPFAYESHHAAVRQALVALQPRNNPRE